MGVLLCAIPSLITSITFVSACIAPIWFLIGALLITTETHLGAKLNAATILLSAGCCSGLLAGAVLTVVWALPGPVRVQACILSVIGLIPLCILRTEPLFGAASVVSTFTYGFILWLGLAKVGIGKQWQTVGYVVLSFGIAAAALVGRRSVATRSGSHRRCAPGGGRDSGTPHFCGGRAGGRHAILHKRRRRGHLLLLLQDTADQR